MNTLEFLDFTHGTKDDRYLGLVTIKWGGIVLRYKVVQRTDGKGVFATTASFKTKDQITLEDKYVNAFEIDSRSENDRVLQFVVSHAKAKLGMTSVQNPHVDAHYAAQKAQGASLPLEYPTPVQQNLPF